ncbi:MAG TPA: hypothetical protein VEJ18_13000 [Planctomycetota bacterium]|nr:hypothetical protein [Planctomycetota bacterium]
MIRLRRLLVLATAAPLLGCVAAEVREILALELPADADAWWFDVSPDGRAAWAERRGSDAYLHADGRRDGPYP